ncbi:hypothetical protein DB346_01315 [Verrucomicrobia bacterium LW23]|nr:hypothetical protein DB346_01315 [Verrucomicrobia bacterium LW23]
MTLHVRSRGSAAFSLVEVALALGIVAFVLLGVMALLPLGVKSNQISRDEARAAGILTALEADLRNTHPALGAGPAGAGKSLQFGMPLPYTVSSSTGQLIFNPSLVKNDMTGGYSVLLDETELPMPATAPAGAPGRFQATIVYTRTPADMDADTLAPIEARLIVNWPSITTSDISDLTNTAKVSGYVEACVTFPAP